MSTLKDTFFGCVAPRSEEAREGIAGANTLPRTPRTPKKQAKLKFGVVLSEAFKDDKLPEPLVAMLVHISGEGCMTTDVFRKGGNYSHVKDVIKTLMEGKPINFHQYSFHTLAAVVKRFLLKVPGGIFGVDIEQQLLSVLHLENRMQQYDKIHSIITSLKPILQQFVSLLFGMWFRIVSNSESNHMSSEAVAKSVAPSVFHTCAQRKELIEKASQVLQILIDDFGVANMFGRKNIQYFADKTQSGINVLEKFRYEYQYPPDDSVPLDTSLQLFVQYLQTEAHRCGFDIEKNAVSEEDYYGGRKGSNVEDSQASCGSAGAAEHNHVFVSSSPPSPQSLQPHYPQDPTDPNYNPHKKLTHVSSLSAPEVNQGIDSPGPELDCTKKMCLSICSLSRSDRVKSRQLMRMKKRSDWFLSPTRNLSSSLYSDSSLLGGGSREPSELMLACSRDPSVGKSSLDATSSDALASDVTASDAGMSDVGGSDGLRLSSDLDCAYDDTTRAASCEPLLHKGQVKQDVINANHGTMATTSTPLKSSPAPVTISMDISSSGSPVGTSPHRLGTETEVHYFMVQNYYPNQENSPS